jgi:heat shock protein HtpX
MWEQIRSNKIRSVALVFAMALLLALLGYFLGSAILGSAIAGLIIALVIWAILGLIAYYQGDSIMLGVARAKKITQADHPRLYNVVEEMKIASGLPKMPDIYIIDDPAMNAFATGRDPQHAAVAITSGLLTKLNRDELQGVIAHEMSHVKNRDVLLMIMAGVMLGAIVMIAWFASRVMFFGGFSSGSRRSSRGGGGGGGGQIIILAIALVFMILAPIFAQLLYFAISRKREYLADASGALYTRYPEGLASALEKIAGSSTPVKAANQATAPMYIVNPFRKQGQSLNDLTATHPPIQDRIRILRAMGGASFADYEQAYKKIHKGSGVMPASAVAAAGAVPLAAGSGSEGPVEQVERARETSNVLWNSSNYRVIDCPCGTRLRVPPRYDAPSVQCPHCGRIHQL